MKTQQSDPRNSNPSYIISPCYRLVMPDPEPTPRERGHERRLDTPRGSAVPRGALPW